MSFRTVIITTSGPNVNTVTVDFVTNAGFMFGDGGSFDLNVNAAVFHRERVFLYAAPGGGFDTPSCALGLVKGIDVWRNQQRVRPSQSAAVSKME